MKQAKSISKGKGIYSCSLLLSKETGKIIAAKDNFKSCAAGKRGFCKHIAALAQDIPGGDMQKTGRGKDWHQNCPIWAVFTGSNDTC